MVTNYSVDRRWQRKQTENGITPIQVLARLNDEMAEILGIRVPMYTIDSKAEPDDEEDYKDAMILRNSLFERCCKIPESDVATDRFPKPFTWAEIDEAELAQLEGKSTHTYLFVNHSRLTRDSTENWNIRRARSVK